MINTEDVVSSISLLGITPGEGEKPRGIFNEKWMNSFSSAGSSLCSGKSLTVSGLFPPLFNEWSLGIFQPWQFEILSFNELAWEPFFKQTHLCREMSLLGQEVVLDTGQTMGRCLGSQETEDPFVSNWFTAGMKNLSEQLSVWKYVTSNIHWIKYWSIGC